MRRAASLSGERLFTSGLKSLFSDKGKSAEHDARLWLGPATHQPLWGGVLFVSTRDSSRLVTLSQAFRAGLAPDGGLYVPAQMPGRLSTVLKDSPAPTLAEEAQRFLEPFFEGDPLESELNDICLEAFNFPCPLTPLDGDDRLLELFHGPTAAFKDFGARFLASCFSRLPRQTEEAPEIDRTILVATSGDTGGAVASAFASCEGHKVWILFPEGGVSPLQEAQLTCWGDRVIAMGVRGSFDDCQHIVKSTFVNDEHRARHRLTSANSINIGRLLPQAAYVWFSARQHLEQFGEPMRAIIPTGNLGHGVAALWAKELGAPIAEIVFALNANRTVLDYLDKGVVSKRGVIRTLANAMDVSIPSNMERLRALRIPSEAIRKEVAAFSFSDEAIRTGLKKAYKKWGVVVCPHTACAVLAREQLDGKGWTMFATAHPAKFVSVVEPVLGQPLKPPPALAEIMRRSTRKLQIAPTVDAMLNAVNEALHEQASWIESR